MNWQSYSHPISDIRDWEKNNRLELRPDFQRNEVWSKAAQIMLIDTILKDIPIPKIYIKSVIREQQTYRIVVDGQQRLTSVLKFVNNELPLNSPYSGEYQDLYFKDLPENIQNNILRYKIDINEIFNPTDDEIRDLYSRVNKYTVQLNKQELRRADFPGDFIKLSEELSELDFFEDGKIFSTKQRRRMLDVEYIEELLTIVILGPQDKKDYLDNICESNMHMEESGAVRETFISAIADINTIFDAEVYPIKKTRFKQKSDFYSLFACVLLLRKRGVLNNEMLPVARERLSEMNELIGPQSDVPEYLEYATRCLSDANSLNNRKWRQDFLLERLGDCYTVEED